MNLQTLEQRRALARYGEDPPEPARGSLVADGIFVAVCLGLVVWLVVYFGGVVWVGT